MGFAHDYATAVLHRGRIPMEPVDFAPDWADRPRKWKFYPGVESFPLPDEDCPPDATVGQGLFAAPGDGAFTLPRLGAMLLDSYGLVGRRLGIQANNDLAALPSYPIANWSRGAASGGGLYPVSIYWACGPSGPVTPGAYYYSVPHQAMQPLLSGDISTQLRDAAGGPGIAGETDQFLVLGVKYWQNAFKYNSFSFHAVSMDVGAAIQTWRTWAHSRGLRIEPLLWFDEVRIAHLLGLSGGGEGIFAVIPLRWDRDRDAGRGSSRRGSSGSPARPSEPAGVQRAERERSARVLTFEAVKGMQAATSEAATRPAPGALEKALPAPASQDHRLIPLPAPRPLDLTVRAALRRRRSSFGRFDARTPVSGAALSAALAAAAASGAGPDAAGPDGRSLVHLYVFVNHVEGVPAGIYEYDAVRKGLRIMSAERPGAFLQKNYFLSNYNVEQAGAVVVPAVRTEAVLDAVGARGYRLVNATVGAVAQGFYTAAATMGLGCGVALGFDSISFIDKLGLKASGESPLLIMMIGHERPGSADFHYEIA